MVRVRTSRRVASLKPGDYDHEIVIVDRDGALGRPDEERGQGASAGAGMERISTEQRLLSAIGEEGSAAPSTPTSPPPDDQESRPEQRPSRGQDQQDLTHLASRPSIEVQANAYHKPSPTNIHTAQVPDPMWEWLWQEWHVNHQEGMDNEGWEYSFAFSKSFSWHGPRWYNSFVRRRAWTRKRGKKKEDDVSVDPHMLNGDYFTVRPASDRLSRRSQPSLASSRASRVTSHSTLGHASNAEMQQIQPDIEDLETLLLRLRFARIDREKLEAVENYLENALDLANLHQEMHEVMSIFIFQASRRLLLSHLMSVYDDTIARLEKEDTQHDRERRDALKQAMEHADEEVRKLAYWSDVKQMAESGESRGAVASHKGWQEEWQGIDQSGPAEPNGGKLPE
ncbi:Meiotically up-regulated like protein [Emericellopsis cladophorae]|uniref:Meiotically up-regulated like protein n=1 Tax=Emericellopsis cladophorae TaxID=2686198 RepID=A0A9Q0BGQ0_9HYPO|nr:Meiotically up-regulated like protein [Emericellopsis cladophorae]KAI6784221.1 Meiotically up-regulated like protein [Emericellopsis cladophorae]